MECTIYKTEVEKTHDIYTTSTYIIGLFSDHTCVSTTKWDEDDDILTISIKLVQLLLNFSSYLQSALYFPKLYYGAANCQIRDHNQDYVAIPL